jgi:fluoride ion exporter CrcB/FEX
MLMTWPEGILAGLKLDGRCRDLLTQDDGHARTVSEHRMHAMTGPDRAIRSIESIPAEPRLQGLVGAAGGGHLRRALEEVVPDLRVDGAPLHLLLDDIAGSTLIAGFAFFRWRDHLAELKDLPRRIPMRSMEGICSGFRTGASSLNPDGTQSGIPHQVQAVPPLVDPEDPLGWHELEPPPAMAMRRARRIDVWADEGRVMVDAMFRDSCWEPDGTEIAVHEYQVLASSDASTATLADVEAIPRVLPYDECPMAAANVGLLVGVPLSDLRSEVLDRLHGTLGCTHLNDALRSLAEVPMLSSLLGEPPAR